jgi:hypothetical protein
MSQARSLGLLRQVHERTAGFREQIRADEGPESWRLLTSRQNAANGGFETSKPETCRKK